MTRRLSTFRPVAQGSWNRRRGGFSMIELLIVITVIAILVSLLLVGVQAAVSRARVATVVAELKNLEQAIKSFSAEFGMEPPSSIVLYESTGMGTGWNTNSAATRSSRSIIRQLWKDYDFVTAVDINHDGDTNDTITLNGAECLVFFLGGVTTTDGTTVTCKGFSKTPSAPFTSLTGSRSGPYYEFKSNQLVESPTVVSGSTNNRIYMYLDSIPGQTRPIQYFSSYGGAGYRVYGLDNSQSTTADNEALPGTFGWVYTKTAGTGPMPYTAAEPYNPNTFQLISPGLDGEYGETDVVGGHLDVDKGVQAVTTYPSASVTPNSFSKSTAAVLRERDNITNFAGGEIH